MHLRVVGLADIGGSREYGIGARGNLYSYLWHPYKYRCVIYNWRIGIDIAKARLRL